jgi:mannose-6-phosphate isomerase
MNAPLAIPLRPVPVTRPWGGRRIAQRFGWPDTAPCGEWWLASCHPGTVTPLREGGLDLPAWLDGPGAALGCPPAHAFPVLLKFLDAAEVLSVQVHPDDEVARRHGLPRGKTEAWYVLEAAPGAHVFLGTSPGVRAAELPARLRPDMRADAVAGLLRRVEVSPGDTLLVRAGTVHAIGPGVTLFEVQQSSDTTYRVHDWGRGRELHLDAARDALRDHPPETPRRADDDSDRWQTLLATPAFALAHGRVATELALVPRAAFALVTVIAGTGTLHSGAHRHTLRPGDTLLVLGETRLVGAALELLSVEAPA